MNLSFPCDIVTSQMQRCWLNLDHQWFHGYLYVLRLGTTVSNYNLVGLWGNCGRFSWTLLVSVVSSRLPNTKPTSRSLESFFWSLCTRNSVNTLGLENATLKKATRKEIHCPPLNLKCRRLQSNASWTHIDIRNVHFIISGPEQDSWTIIVYSTIPCAKQLDQGS